MTASIDYSRPVGWWCPVCHMQWPQYPNTLIRQHQHAVIPVFEPTPEGQRPPAASEVEKAEVVTWQDFCGVWHLGKHSDFVMERGEGSPSSSDINYIVTGATE